MSDIPNMKTRLATLETDIRFYHRKMERFPNSANYRMWESRIVEFRNRATELRKELRDVQEG